MIQMEPGTFYIEAESDEDIQNQWYFEDESLPGETGYSLEVRGSNGAGDYKCVVSTAHLSRELLFHVYIENDFYAYADGSSYIRLRIPTIQSRLR